MEFLAQSLLYTHIVAGFISLTLFWIPVFARKGGLNHRRVGRWYAYGMWVALATAILLSLNNLYSGRPEMGIFLGFLSLLTAKPLWLATSILKKKQGIDPGYYLKLLSANALLVVSGIALIAYGISLGSEGMAIYMFIFGGLGVSSVFELMSLLRKSFSEKDWLIHHINGMGVGGIAAHTAFMAFGASGLLTNLYSTYWAIIPWVAPTVIGTIAISLSIRKYAK